MNTSKFSFTLGTCAGYFHNNASVANVEVVSEKYIEAAEKVMAKTEIFISAVITPSRCLYSHSWGCPQGGEETYTFEGVRNPQFCKNDSAWREAVEQVASALRSEFKQSTVTVEFSEIDMKYLS